MALAMDKRQLPLNALRAFEATGRLLNMRLAAEELGVTHGAVSHQVRALEDRLGVSLFLREHNKLKLTPQGHRYYLELHRIFAEMVQATLSLDLKSLDGPLRVGCSADTAVNWLVPALSGFMLQYPEIELHVAALNAREEVAADIEVGILCGSPLTDVYTAEPLRQLRFFPVCAPELMSGGSIPLKQEELLNYRLLHSDDGQCWSEWLSAAGMDRGRISGQLFLPNVATTLAAARQGLGIALAQDLEVESDFFSGSLIQLSGLAVISTQQYNLITLKDSLLSDRARVFADWVRGLASGRESSGLNRVAI